MCATPGNRFAGDNHAIGHLEPHRVQRLALKPVQPRAPGPAFSQAALRTKCPLPATAGMKAGTVRPSHGEGAPRTRRPTGLMEKYWTRLALPPRSTPLG